MRAGVVVPFIGWEINALASALRSIRVVESCGNSFIAGYDGGDARDAVVTPHKVFFGSRRRIERCLTWHFYSSSRCEADAGRNTTRIVPTIVGAVRRGCGARRCEVWSDSTTLIASYCMRSVAWRAPWHFAKTKSS